MRITLSLKNYSRKPLNGEMGQIKYQRKSVSQEELVEHIKKRSRSIC